MCRKEVLLQELKSASLQRSPPRMALLVLPKSLLQPKPPHEVLAPLLTVCIPPQDQPCSSECYMLSAFFLKFMAITNRVHQMFSPCAWMLCGFLFILGFFFVYFFWGGGSFIPLSWPALSSANWNSYLLPTLYFYSFVLFWNPKVGLYVASQWILKI